MPRRVGASHAQRRIWLISQLEGDRSYHLLDTVRFDGPVDAAALERAFEVMAARHEVLRTTFVNDGGQLLQVVAPAAPSALTRVDLSQLPGDVRSAAVLKATTKAVHEPFDLARGPLFRPTLLRCADDEHYLLVDTHHIISDEWSTKLVINELIALYQAFRSGLPSPLPELAVQYGDFAEWQAEWPTRAVRDADLAYWTKQLAGAPPVLDLPLDRPRPAREEHDGFRVARTLSKDVVERLRDVSRNADVTLFMTMLAALFVLLKRHSGQGDLTIGSPITMRPRGAEKTIGLFLNTLVLRADLSGDPSFPIVLERVRELVLDAFEHQQTPFESVVEAVNPPRSLRHAPLFQVLFAFQNVVKGTTFPGITVDAVLVQERSSAFDMSYFVYEQGDEMRIVLEYKTGLFDQSTMERMLARFVSLLEQIAEDPRQSKISRYSLLLPSDNHLDVGASNANQRDWGARGTLLDLFARRVAEAGDAVAVMWGRDELSYRELDARSNRLARHLRQRGARAEECVGVFLERGPELVVALLGVLKASAAYVPLDPELPADRLSLMVSDSRLRLLVTQSKLRGAIGGVEEIAMDSAALASESSDACALPAIDEQLAYVMYTSGSTGRPKGVSVTHRALANFLCSMQEAPGLTAADRLVAVTTQSFDISGLELYLPLVVGGRIVLASRDQARDGQALKRLVEASAATALQATPATWRMLLDSGWRGGTGFKALCGGEALPADLADRIQSCAGELWNLYGPTETTIWSSRCRVVPGESIHLGEPIANTQLHVIESESLEAAPTGVAGELFIGGAGLARGYFGKAALTAERFVPDPFATAPGRRMYRTGDLVRRVGCGGLEFLGRVDHQVKIRGYRIELEEIEARLARHAAVRQVVVIARDDAALGKRLVAYLVGTRESAANLRGFLGALLPEYMVPSAFVWLDALPLTPSGKLDRKALPAPDDSTMARAEFVAPQTDVERALAEIWCELLGIERVGREDDFFRVGGHSLLAVQLVERVRERFGHALALRQIYETSALALLASAIEPSRDAEALVAAGIVPQATGLRRSHAYSAQEVLWHLDRAAPGNGFLQAPIFLRCPSVVSRELLSRVVRALVERHSMLRSVVTPIDGVLTMEVRELGRDAGPPIEVIDLSDVAAGDVRERTNEVLDELWLRPFDLERGFPVRGAVVHLPDGTSMVGVVLHHVSYDAYSCEIVREETSRLLEAFSADPAISAEAVLGPAPLQYIDFVDYTDRVARSEEGEHQAEYWRGQLRGAKPPMMPIGRPEPPHPAGRPGEVLIRRAREVSALIQPASKERIAAIARETRTNRYSAMLAGLAAAHYASTGQDDLTVQSTLAQRSRPELRRVVGFMVNPLVMRLRVDVSDTFRQLVTRVCETQLAAYEHGVVPIRNWIPPEMFRINFNYQFRGQPPALASGYESYVSPSTPRDQYMPFDLQMVVQEQDPAAKLVVRYNIELFSADEAQAFLRRYCVRLDALCTHPDLPMRRVIDSATAGP